MKPTRKPVKSGNRKNAMLVLTASAVEFPVSDGQAPAFSGIAYTGGLLYVNGWDYPVVVDLAALRHPEKARPVLLDHDQNRPVGHFDPGGLVNSGFDLRLNGHVSGANEWAASVIESSKNRFPWQMSIGVGVQEAAFVFPGETVSANGQTFAGPLYITKEASVREVSFVALGADDNTSAAVAAKRVQGGSLMSFEEYVKSLGLDLESLTEEAKKALETAFAGQGKDGDGGDDKSLDAAGAGDGENEDEDEEDVAVVKAGMKKHLHSMERASRMMEITTVAADPKYASLAASARQEVIAKARKGNLSIQHATDLLELALLRASRPTAPLPPSGGHALDAAALSAGMMLRFGVREETIEKSLSAASLDMARKRLIRCGFKDMARYCIEFEGRQWQSEYNHQNDTSWLRAAFSTASFPQLLKDSVNKFLMDAYQNQSHVSRQLARKLTANDYKIHTGVRYTGGGTWDKVSAGGKLKYGTLGKEESFTYQVEDWGEIVSIPSTMLVNDDLGAIQDALRSNIAVKCARTEERSFFDMLQKNAGNFFSAANNNTITTALNSDGLKEAIYKFRMLKDAHGEPIELAPKLLLVPPSLEHVANLLCNESNFQPGGANTDKLVPTKNEFLRYKLEVVTTAQLVNERYAKGGVKVDDLAKRWYLLAAPESGAVWGRAYLDGTESPTIEEVPNPSDTLGVAYRGYMPFGHCQIDSRCAIMSSGTTA